MQQQSSTGPHDVKYVRLLWDTIKTIGAHRIFVVYIAFVALCCEILCVLEPDVFVSYTDAIWYVFQIITTIGFGDITPNLLASQIISIVVGLSALFIVALITGVVVSFFNERAHALRNESFLAFNEQLNRLSTLNHEELVDLEERYRDFVNNKNLLR